MTHRAARGTQERAGAGTLLLRRYSSHGAAAEHHPERDQLRQREARHDAVVAAQELDEEALGAGQHEVEREQPARAHAVAYAPQQPGDERPS